MKVLQINSVYKMKSTGRIAADIVDIQQKHKMESYVACSLSGAQDGNVYIIGTPVYQKANVMLTRIFGKHGFYNRNATKKMLKWVDTIKPDIIHLHNIHGHYLNVKLLFEYIKKKNIPVVWTLHDCWAFTGHCAHFDYAGCDKWKSGCSDCKQKKKYPVSLFFDRSKESYADKKALFTSAQKMHIVTPSEWLARLCKQSFLKKYPVTAIHNGIDTKNFEPKESDMKRKLGIEDKYVILGIVKNLNDTKGGKHFIEMSEMLSDDEVIVLLSLDEKQENLPRNVIALPSTADIDELAKVYSMADVLANPTLEDTFPTINIEALCCGTPVVTFDTGGSKESLDELSGFVVPRTDTKGMYEAIQKVKQGAIKAENCRKRGLEFEAKNRFEKYAEIYNALV